MTQGNVTDAGPGLRASLLARLDELIAGCKRGQFSVPGPWRVDRYLTRREETEGNSGVVGSGSGSVARNLRHPISEHIAAHSPDLMLRVWEGLRAEVERHKIEPVEQQAGYFCAACRWPTYGSPGAPCSFVSRWATALGVDAPEQVCWYCAAAKQKLRSAGGSPEAVAMAGCTTHAPFADDDPSPPSAGAATPHAEEEPSAGLPAYWCPECVDWILKDKETCPHIPPSAAPQAPERSENAGSPGAPAPGEGVAG